MLEIIKPLVEFGMDFEYEHMGSLGERINCYQLGLVIRLAEGTITVEHEGESSTFHDTNTKRCGVAGLVEQLCINETSSF